MKAEASCIIPADWHLWSETRPSVIRPLAGGLTNQSYLLSAGGRRLVLRKNSPISAALDLDRAAEVAALRQADRAGLCAPLVYSDPDHQYLVTEYLEGAPWRAQGPADLQALAQLLRRIHALPAIGVRLDLAEKVGAYWNAIDEGLENYRTLAVLEKQCRQKLADLAASARRDCLCHNDLSTGNLIVTGDAGLLAIDWEYAAMGDPFYDLAVVIEDHCLNLAEQKVLLEEYLDEFVSHLDWQRLYRWRIIYKYLCILWYSVKSSSSVEFQKENQQEIMNRASELVNFCSVNDCPKL
ncbi:thiamine kinase [Microbulbifer aestuariivivens]|uniref:Thiamine kinase n=1 Tax=Microbulbifer aestuariivivens TaxID=1908308 RepID=A0ABP9WU81_9GAMM